ncbi:ABC transporter permease [Lactobacillus sp. CC-MHH1034]|uniref:ABC transporter permease n=1 Tax=Agrilactobacillus fermenti TaxID=2586909 RepID=UPI001E59EBEB|nr:ABC transporter permease [Agrilactobacillus fermenti]MCD2255885.1 ABC transporter permease [Agrilactobacillus fermenti]
MFLALRELKQQKLRYGLVGLIIFLIIFLVLFITGLANGLTNDTTSALEKSPAETFVLQKGSENRLNRSKISTADAKKIQDQVGGTAMNVQQTTVQTKNNADKKTDVAYFAMNANSSFVPTATNGKTLSNQKNGIIVSDKLKENGYKVGSVLKDSISGKNMKIIGFVNNLSYAHTPVVYMSTKLYQTISPQMAQGLTYNTVATKSNASNLDLTGFTKSAKATIIDNIPGHSAESGSLTMMITFLYVISIVVLAVFFYVITIQKLREFGTLKAIGTSTSYLARNLIYEIGLITLGAIAIGSLVIFGLSYVMPSGMPFIMGGSTIAFTAGIFIVVAVISSLVSLVKIAKVDPVSAIGGNA